MSYFATEIRKLCDRKVPGHEMISELQSQLPVEELVTGDDVSEAVASFEFKIDQHERHLARLPQQPPSSLDIALSLIRYDVRPMYVCWSRGTATRKTYTFIESVSTVSTTTQLPDHFNVFVVDNMTHTCLSSQVPAASEAAVHALEQASLLLHMKLIIWRDCSTNNLNPKTTSDDQQRCPICWQGLLDSQNEHITTTTCNHTFHTACIDQWSNACVSKRVAIQTSHCKMETLKMRHYCKRSNKRCTPWTSDSLPFGFLIFLAA
jgi:Ring finger domain